MRIFIAIEVAKGIEDYLSELQKLFLPEDIKVNFVKSFHLTLKFLGEVEENNINNIIEKLENVKSDSFNTNLSVLGVFPNQNYIKVIWIGLTNQEKVIELQKKIESQLPGFQIDKRFHPHITLGRVKFVKNKEKVIEALKTKIEAKEIKATSFSLMKSTLTPEGPKYEKIKEFKLN